MLHINDLSYRIEGRALFEHAAAVTPAGHKALLADCSGNTILCYVGKKDPFR